MNTFAITIHAGFAISARPISNPPENGLELAENEETISLPEGSNETDAINAYNGFLEAAK